MTVLDTHNFTHYGQWDLNKSSSLYHKPSLYSTCLYEMSIIVSMYEFVQVVCMHVCVQVVGDAPPPVPFSPVSSPFMTPMCQGTSHPHLEAKGGSTIGNFPPTPVRGVFK